MTRFDADPAAEIAYLKAIEKTGQPAFPDAPPTADALKKKAHNWPDVPAGGKKKTRRVPHAWVAPDLQPSRPFVQGGYTLAEVIRAALFFGALLAAALLID